MAATVTPPRKSLGQRLMERKILLSIVIVVILVVGIVAAAAFTGVLFPKPSISLWYNSTGHYGDTEPAVAQIIKASLEKTGKFTVNLNSEPWATYTNDFGNGRLPFFLLGWYPDYFDPDDYASPFVGAAGAASLGSDYNNSRVNTWLSQEAATTNSTLRAQLFGLIQNKTATDVPYIPLWEGKANIVYDQDITNVFLHPVTFKYFVMGNPDGRLNGQLTVGTTDSITSLDPAAAYDYFSIEVINQVFDTLLVYAPNNLTLLPGLATKVPSVANGLIRDGGATFEFPLRAGVKFSDGTPFNATALVWSIKRAIHLDISGSGAFLLYDSGALTKTPNIQVVNQTDVIFHLKSPVTFFNDIMAFSVSAPVSMSAFSNTTQLADNSKAVGAGPYKIVGYTANQQVILQTNPTYYAPTLYSPFGIPTIPILNKVTLNLFSSASALYQAIKTHSINMAYRTLNPTDIISLQGLAASLSLKIDFGTSPQIRYLVFNVKTAPFNDVKVRQAIAYAIDRATILGTVFYGQVDPLYSMIPGIMPFSQPVFATAYGTSPNLTQANNLLSQTSLALGLTVFQRATIVRSRI